MGHSLLLHQRLSPVTPDRDYLQTRD